MFQIGIFLRERLLGRSTFDDEEVRIGRSADNEVCIDNLAFSRYHASIETVDSVQVLRDFSSQNGTFVNGERVVGRRALNDGDRITIGKFVLAYRADKKPESGKAAIRDAASYALAGQTLCVPLANPASDVRERSCPFLGYLEGGTKGIVHPLARDVSVIGSSPEAAVTVAAPAAARVAAIVRGWRGFSLVALGPGLKRNGKLVDHFVSLRSGDQVVVGAETFTFRVGRPETA
jgi:hypothetical protein